MRPPASAPSSTRTAPEPAFTEEESKGAGLSTATAVLHARGYTPANTSDYHSSQALRVLIGVRTGSGDGYGQQAFFFVNGRYIGTDASQPSAALRVVGQGDTEVTLAYPLYRSGDPLCCPSRGHRQVHFQLDNGKLTALAGSWSGPEKLYPSPWGPGGQATGRMNARLSVDGFFLLQDYEEEKDGSVVIPPVLRPYMGGMDVIKR